MSSADTRDLAQPQAGRALFGARRGRSFQRWARRRPVGAACLVLLAAMLLIAIIGPRFVADPLEFNLTDRLVAPGTKHWFGTDDRGRDTFARTVFGLRTSLQVGALSAFIGVTAGLLVGLVSGYRGGVLDSVAQWSINSFLAFPPLLLAMGATLALGRSVLVLSVALALISWPSAARIIRAVAVAQASLTYVEAAAVIGASPLRIAFRHILPNVVSIFIVLLSAAVAQNILVEASLSYLGVGIRPPDPSLGSMVLDSQRFAEQAVWLILAPGVMIALCVFCFSLLGDELRDTLDPRLRGDR